MVKNLPANAGDTRQGFDPWVRKIPCKRAWQPTPVFLPGESHGQKTLEGYSPWCYKESDMTKLLTHRRFLIHIIHIIEHKNCSFICPKGNLKNSKGDK